MFFLANVPNLNERYRPERPPGRPAQGNGNFWKWLIGIGAIFLVFFSLKAAFSPDENSYDTPYVTATPLRRDSTVTPNSIENIKPTNTPPKSNTPGSTNTPKPTNTPRPTNTRRPFEPYTAIPGCAQARVIIGDIVEPTTDLFIRSSSDNHPSDNIISHLKPGQKAEVIAGPECSWKWMMWKIRRLSDNFEGWVAESNGEEFWLKLDD